MFVRRLGQYLYPVMFNSIGSSKAFYGNLGPPTLVVLDCHHSEIGSESANCSFLHSRPLQFREISCPRPKDPIWRARGGRIDMNILKTSALAAALTGSLCAMAPSVSYAQWPSILEAKAIAEEG